MHEKRSSAPEGFVYHGIPSPDEKITLQVSLRSHNITGLEERLWDISDPNSLNYGKHMSKEEVGKQLQLYIF